MSRGPEAALRASYEFFRDIDQASNGTRWYS